LGQLCNATTGCIGFEYPGMQLKGACNLFKRAAATSALYLRRSYSGPTYGCEVISSSNFSRFATLSYCSIAHACFCQYRYSRG
jgi:hypothetical protein